MNKYKRVYFRINTPTYYKSKYGVGFENAEESEKFHNEADSLFIKNDWKIKEKNSIGSSTTVAKGKQKLYLHPQQFSGVVLESEIKNIEEIINDGQLFYLTKTDIYEDVYDVSEEEYIEMLRTKQNEIETDLLDVCKTKRRDRFVTSDWNIINKVLDKYRIKRITKYNGLITDGDADILFIADVLNGLVEQGKIIKQMCSKGMGYRTINKTEQKKLGIEI